MIENVIEKERMAARERENARDWYREKEEYTDSEMESENGRVWYKEKVEGSKIGVEWYRERENGKI